MMRSVDRERTMARALIRAQAGNTAGARKLLERVLHAWPDDVEALRFLGEMLIAAGEEDAGAAYLQRLLTIEPQHPYALFRMGMLAESRREYQAALGWYDRALQYFPSSDTRARAECLLQMGMARWQMRLHEDAVRAWREAVRLDPDLEKAQYLLRTLTNEYGQPFQPSAVLDDIAAFRSLKMQEYLTRCGKPAFTDPREAGRVMRSISDAWVALPDKPRLSVMTAAEKMRFFRAIPIAFDHREAGKERD